MGELGNVIKKNKNKVTVALMRTDACAKCRACSVGMDAKTMEIECENLCNADINDTVEVVLEVNSFFAAVSIMYGIPFIAFLIGTLAGYFSYMHFNAPNAELLSFLTGLVFVAVSYLCIRALEKYWKSKNFIPKAIKIHEIE